MLEVYNANIQATFNTSILIYSQADSQEIIVRIMENIINLPLDQIN